MKDYDRLPAAPHDPRPGEPTAIIRYVINAEILLFRTPAVPVAGPARNGTPLEGPLVADALATGMPAVSRLHLAGPDGVPHDPPEGEDRHWSDQGL